MSWMRSKDSRKKKNMRRVPKIKWEASGLGALVEKAPVLIEDIRLQGIMLASRGVGQGARSRHTGGSSANSAPAVHSRRRGATA
jgi:hypothetical protein